MAVKEQNICSGCCYFKEFNRGIRPTERVAVCVYEAFQADTFEELKRADIPITVGFAYACSDFKESE